MGKGGGEILLLLGLQYLHLHLLHQAVGHAVEVPGQCSDLIAAFVLGAQGVVPVGNPAGQPSQAADRPRNIAGQEIDADAACGQQAQKRDAVSGQEVPPGAVGVRQLPAHTQVHIVIRDAGLRDCEHVIAAFDLPDAHVADAAVSVVRGLQIRYQTLHLLHKAHVLQIFAPIKAGAVLSYHEHVPPVPLHAARDAVQRPADGIVLPVFLRGLVSHLKEEEEGAAVVIALFDFLVQKLGEIRGEHPCPEHREHHCQKRSHDQKQFICESHVSPIPYFVIFSSPSSRYPTL